MSFHSILSSFPNDLINIQISDYVFVYTDRNRIHRGSISTEFLWNLINKCHSPHGSRNFEINSRNLKEIHFMTLNRIQKNFMAHIECILIRLSLEDENKWESIENFREFRFCRKRLRFMIIRF